MLNMCFPYSLGDAIDWKLKNTKTSLSIYFFPYSLGDAIDWKQLRPPHNILILTIPLLARGRDRLETYKFYKQHTHEYKYVPYSLGDAIDWKQNNIIFLLNTKHPCSPTR